MPMQCPIVIIQPCMVIIDGIEPNPALPLVTSNDVMSVRTTNKMNSPATVVRS